MYINNLRVPDLFTNSHPSLIPRISRKLVLSHHEDMQVQSVGGTGGKQQIRVFIRWMVEKDMREVLSIENASQDYPWCEEDFLRRLRQNNCVAMVAEQGEKVVGFMLYELHKKKLRILNFAVHPEFRCLGIGKQMVEKLVSKLSSRGRDRIVLVVRETGLDAQLFFRSCKFRATGVSREFYPDTGEDAYTMERRLQEPMENSQAAGSTTNIRSAS